MQNIPIINRILGLRTARVLRASFRARLFAGIAAVILVVSSAFAALLFYQQYRSQQEKLVNEGNLKARLLARDVRLAVFSGKSDTISEAAQGIMSFPDIQAVEVYDKDNVLIARLARPTSNTTSYAEFTSIIPGLLNRQMEQSLFVGKNWGGDPEAAIGKVRVIIDETRLHRQFHRLILIALLTTSALLALGLMSAYFLARSMTRPLLQLSTGASLLERGDYTVRVSVTTEDEYGQLADTFNSMVDAIRLRKVELESALQELSRMNVVLEEKVRERTAQLEGANRELESFNYSASHDLRAPLNRLAGFCDALKEEYGDVLDEQGRLYLARISAVGEQMNRVLSAMLTLYQVQQREIVVKRLNLSEIVQAVHASLREANQGRQIEIEIQRDVMVYGDMKLLWLALENLLGNAWKFTAGKAIARIEFGQIEYNGALTCFIRDNGAGFDMTYSDKLFTPFQRLHNHEEFPGTGVGLAIVQRIMARHGGKIWLESIEGSGTTCYFILPVDNGFHTRSDPEGSL